MTALFENIIITYSEKGQRVCTLYVYIYIWIKGQVWLRVVVYI